MKHFLQQTHRCGFRSWKHFVKTIIGRFLGKTLEIISYLRSCKSTHFIYCVRIWTSQNGTYQRELIFLIRIGCTSFRGTQQCTRSTWKQRFTSFGRTSITKSLLHIQEFRKNTTNTPYVHSCCVLHIT